MFLRRAIRALLNQFVILVLLRTRVWIKAKIIDRALARDIQNVARVQRDLLLRILRFQQDTEYGRLHGFAEVRDVADYRNRVPVNDYETLRPWFEKQEREQALAINAEQPLLYTLTSGTTGKPKLIPVLRQTIKNNTRIQNVFLNYLFRARPHIADGRILTIVSAAVEGETEHSRTPFGATTGYMYASAPKIAQKKYIVPPEIFDIADYDTRFAFILRLALLEPNITYMTTANPTTFIRLINLLNEDWDRWMQDLECGGFATKVRLTEKQREIVRKRLVPAPERARNLQAIRNAKADGRMRFRDIWPNVQAVGVWTGGSCGIFVDRLKEEFSPATLFRDLGYHSSEFRGSSPIFSYTSAGIPTFRENFFEFVERDAWDAGTRDRFSGLHELKDGHDYYVFVTTDAGLYRYNMNDIVRVDGFYGQVPLIRFVQKGKGVTSITGEKLYETQAIASVVNAEAEFGLKSVFYMMLADETKVGYTLYYEANAASAPALAAKLAAFTREIDAVLGDINLEYKAKRASGRLAPLALVPLKPNTYESYKKFCLAQGQRESQFKIVALNYAREMKFDFTAAALSAPLSAEARLPLRPETATREAMQFS